MLKKFKYIILCHVSNIYCDCIVDYDKNINISKKGCYLAPDDPKQADNTNKYSYIDDENLLIDLNDSSTETWKKYIIDKDKLYRNGLVFYDYYRIITIRGTYVQSNNIL